MATREVRELIEALRHRGVTVFLTTHRLEEAERLCDRIAILNTTLRIVGAPSDLRHRLFSATLEVRTAAPLANPDEVLSSVPGATGWESNGDASYRITVRDPRVAAPPLARAIVSSGADLLQLTEGSHSLEDVYLELVDEDVEAQR